MPGLLVSWSNTLVLIVYHVWTVWSWRLLRMWRGWGYVQMLKLLAFAAGQVYLWWIRAAFTPPGSVHSMCTRAGKWVICLPCCWRQCLAVSPAAVHGLAFNSWECDSIRSEEACFSSCGNLSARNARELVSRAEAELCALVYILYTTKELWDVVLHVNFCMWSMEFDLPGLLAHCSRWNSAKPLQCTFLEWTHLVWLVWLFVADVWVEMDMMCTSRAYATLSANLGLMLLSHADFCWAFEFCLLTQMKGLTRCWTSKQHWLLTSNTICCLNPTEHACKTTWPQTVPDTCALRCTCCRDAADHHQVCAPAIYVHQWVYRLHKKATQTGWQPVDNMTATGYTVYV